MKWIFNIGLALVVMVMAVSHGFAQSAEATALLEKTMKKMQSPAGVEADFTMQMYFGSDLELEEQGTVKSKGEHITMDMAQLALISDGKSTWTVLKERNEIQINDVSSDDFSMYNPTMLLNHFFEGGFAYDIVARDTEMIKLDFKPTDPNSEYAKITVNIESKNETPKSFLLVQKDGVRYNIMIDELNLSPNFSDTDFIFSKADYPGAMIEDLRLGE